MFKPPSLNCSPSFAASHPTHQKKRKVVPQYSHWFAIEARNVYDNIDLLGSDIQVTVQAHTTTVMQQSLDQFIQEFQCIQQIHDRPAVVEGYLGDSELRKRELLKIALMARALDRFLFPDDQLKTLGGCYHQLPSRAGTHRPEAPDVTVMALQGNVPTSTVLMADGKNSGLEAAEIESCMYVVTLMQQLKSNTVLLGLPFDQNQVSLKVYVGYDASVLEMTVCLVSREDTQGLRRLFCTLYGCVHALILSPILSTYQSGITIKCCDGNHKILSIPVKEGGYSHLCTGARVIHCEGKNLVYKYYNIFHRDFNIAANEVLPNAAIEHLNTQVTRLQYQYLCGSHTPLTIAHVRAIISKLYMLHCEGLVHSDIRSENLIFCTDNVSAHIIDFDLADEEEKRYPVEYVSRNIPERHPEARSGKMRAKSHDRYSLHYVLTRKSQLGLNQAIEMLLDESNDLNTIASSIDVISA